MLYRMSCRKRYRPACCVRPKHYFPGDFLACHDTVDKYNLIGENSFAVSSVFVPRCVEQFLMFNNRSCSGVARNLIGGGYTF